MPHANDACRFSPTPSPEQSASSGNRSRPPVLSLLPRLAERARMTNNGVASWHAPATLAEQRSWHRVRYDRPAVLTPLDERTGTPQDVHKIISGRDISPCGFSFSHLDPLACRRAIITFAYESESPPWDAVVIRLSWCRFTQAGIYQSGGKFLGITECPFPGHSRLQDLPYA